MSKPLTLTQGDLVAMGVDQLSYPQYLFKYRADGVNTDNIVTKNELWFSNPLKFNDPYDCNPPINITTSLEEIKKWLKSVGIYEEDIDMLSNALKANPHILKEATEKAMAELGVCCFSTLEDSILQWSHYANYHTGICFKFDVKINPDFFHTPVVVAYRKTLQHYNHFLHKDKLVEYLIRPKFSDWSYESEVRIVKDKHDILKNGNSRAFRFDDTALTEVIFGVHTDPNTIEKYKSLCAMHNKSHVQFFKMELATGTHYGLNKIESK